MVEDSIVVFAEYIKITGGEISGEISAVAGIQRNNSGGGELKQLDFRRRDMYPFGLCGETGVMIK